MDQLDWSKSKNSACTIQQQHSRELNTFQCSKEVDTPGMYSFIIIYSWGLRFDYFSERHHLMLISTIASRQRRLRTHRARDESAYSQYKSALKCSAITSFDRTDDRIRSTCLLRDVCNVRNPAVMYGRRKELVDSTRIDVTSSLIITLAYVT